MHPFSNERGPIHVCPVITAAESGQFYCYTHIEREDTFGFTTFLWHVRVDCRRDQLCSSESHAHAESTTTITTTFFSAVRDPKHAAVSGQHKLCHLLRVVERRRHEVVPRALIRVFHTRASIHEFSSNTRLSLPWNAYARPRAA